MDYRAALRDRSGVGEFTHQLAAALLRAFPSLELSIFSSSWKDRLQRSPDLDGAHAIDRRVPVALLNFAWHRLGWPAAETITGERFDVAHSMHPLILPSQSAAPVVTIYDLNFLTHPEWARAEIRRDYPSLARDHAHRAARIVTISEFSAGEIVRHLGVPRDRVAVCTPGAPDWRPRTGTPREGYILFFGTLGPRKNVGGLLDAYEVLVGPAKSGHYGLGRQVPRLVLAGRATAESRPWLDRIERPPLKGRVQHLGYVDPATREALYAGARVLVQPSFEEGFGMPVVEAMAIGVPVVAANRGALPEVLGDAGLLVDPARPSEIAAAIDRLLTDEAFAAGCAARGVARAREFSWERTARRVYDAYHDACASA
jgi:glycosyltransferase involved in cell wall biosynthesis